MNGWRRGLGDGRSVAAPAPRRADRRAGRRDGRDWPDEQGWAELRAADRLDELEPPRRVTPVGSCIELDVELPMPSISLLELHPVS